MKEFKYSFIARVIYRYANIPANLILLFYLFASAYGMTIDWKFIFPVLLNIILLYVLNKFYLKIYRTFPFNIKVDNEKMICTDFVINNKEVEIVHSDIVKIKGGIFSGRAYAPLYISTDNITIGISPHIKDYDKLLTIILTNIPKELYESLLEAIKKIAFDNTPKKDKKVK
ncbi:MAG: hypothetical protein R3250_05215 [Melioribacteraceae bacterium]|nr:hypothetical protein [Melioribacteraceae bacterium]